MSFFEFPHRRTYDSDLGWLIKKMQELMNEYYALMQWKTEHELEYNDLLRRVTDLERAIASFESEIEQRFDELERELSAEIYRQLQDALREIQQDLGIMQNQILALREDLTRVIIDYHAYDDATREYLIEYIEARLNEFIQEIPDLTTVNVYNPVKGYITSIQEAINDLYNQSRAEALTALEYDSLGLTAAEYDALQLTAWEYDNWGKTLIQNSGYYRNSWHYMTSPFTGEYVRLEVVINELASLHKSDALTASEYDALDITASYYDGLDLTAYQYDWNGKTLVI